MTCAVRVPGWKWVRIGAVVAVSVHIFAEVAHHAPLQKPRSKRTLHPHRR